jgi:hypothetical protein
MQNLKNLQSLDSWGTSGKLQNKLFILFLLFLFSCAPSRLVKPLEKGEQQVNASFGGPLINFAGTTIPIPFTTLSYANGVADKTSVFASVHTTSLMFGVFQTDIGVVKELFSPDSTSRITPGISVAPAVNITFDKWENNFRVWPQIDINAYWLLGKNRQHYFYTGLSNWFEFKQVKAHNEIQRNQWIFSPQAGIVLSKIKWNHQVELKYLAPEIQNNNTIVGYNNPLSNKGAIGIYYSVSRKF